MRRVATVRARVSDPLGPRLWGAAVRALGVVPALLAAPFGLGAFASAVCLASAWAFAAGAVLGRLRPRDAVVHLEAGSVVVAGAGPLSQRIRGCDVRAAKLVGTPAPRLALVRAAPRRRPVILEASSPAELLQIARALGIGPGGVGQIAMRTGGPRRLPTLLRAACSLAWLAMGVFVALGAIELALGVALAAVPASLLAVTMSLGEGLAPAESAAERELATGAPLPADALVEGEGLAPLLPREHEGPRMWLERLDALAASLTREDGYRQAGIDVDALWSTLERPEASDALRAAAARVLARVAPESSRPRVTEALATVRDGVTRARIAAALEEDVDEAARELDRLARD